MSTAVSQSSELNQFVELAQKHDRAGSSTQAARFYRLAGEAAAAAWAYEDAATYLGRALELTPVTCQSACYALLLTRERVFGRLGRSGDQENDLVSLSELAHSLADDRLQAEVAARMAEYKLARGEYRDATHIVHLGLRLAQLSAAEREAMVLRQIWGRALMRQGAYCEARPQLQQALAQAKAAGWRQETADNLRYLGVLHMEQAEFDLSMEHYEQAFELYVSLQDRRGQSDVLNNLGNVAHACGEFSKALAYWDRAKTLYEATGDRVGACRLLINQSAVCLDVGNYEEARKYNEEALAISREIDLPFGQGLALINLALAEHHCGNQQAALRAGCQALVMAREMNSNRLEGYALNALGKVLLSLGELEAAAERHWQALALWHELGQPNHEMDAHAGLARVALAGGDSEQSLTHVAAVLEFLQSGQSLDGTESPLSIYLACYEVLASARDPRAPALLCQANNHLRDRAMAIKDDAARRSFLWQVAANRTLAAHYQRHSGAMALQMDSGEQADGVNAKAMSEPQIEEPGKNQ